jgi:CBS domain-containing protein
MEGLVKSKGRCIMLKELEVKAGDLMSTDIVTVAPGLSLRGVVDLFATRHVGGAPVLAGSRVVGVVSASDILTFEASTPGVPPAEPDRPEWELEPPEEWREGDEAPAAFFSDLWPDAGAEVVERFEQTGSPEWDLLAEHTVDEVMSRRVAAVNPETPIRAVARLMTALQIHRVLVLEQGRLLGVLTASDIVRAVAEVPL